MAYYEKKRVPATKTLHLVTFPILQKKNDFQGKTRNWASRVAMSTYSRSPEKKQTRRHGRLRPQFSRERFVLFVLQTQEKKSVFLGVHPWAKTFPRGNAEIFKR